MSNVSAALVCPSRDWTTFVWVDDWMLELEGDRYRSRILARDFSLDLEFVPRVQVVLQGEDGFSRKGPREEEASFYYSRQAMGTA